MPIEQEPAEPELNVLRRSAGEIQIHIDEIVRNRQIAGRVEGLESGAESKHKVLVYVHTDIWYIHPYAGRGAGQTWAAVDQEGHWFIGSVKRTYPADQVAALLVSRDSPHPSSLKALTELESVAWVVVEGTGDV